MSDIVYIRNTPYNIIFTDTRCILVDNTLLTTQFYETITDGRMINVRVQISSTRIWFVSIRKTNNVVKDEFWIDRVWQLLNTVVFDIYRVVYSAKKLYS